MDDKITEMERMLAKLKEENAKLAENAQFAQADSPGYRPAVINAIVAAWLPAAPVT